MRKLVCLLLAAWIGALQGSTLQQLSLDDMIQKSTLIVRGKAHLTGAGFRGPIVYTHYQVQVSEIYKGSPGSRLDVAVFGGTANGVTQRFAGAPTLEENKDDVLFLWTSKSGVTQVIGLSQGLFSVTSGGSGLPMVARSAASEQMLNAQGQPVVDTDLKMQLGDLKSRIQMSLNTGGTQ